MVNIIFHGFQKNPVFSRKIEEQKQDESRVSSGGLNSKTRIKPIDVNTTINDKTATIKYNISDTAIGLLLISGNIGSGVYFSIVINYGTKWSMKLLSFTASNTDTSSIAINTDLGKITFNGNSKLESFYKVNGLLFG